MCRVNGDGTSLRQQLDIDLDVPARRHLVDMIESAWRTRPHILHQGVADKHDVVGPTLDQHGLASQVAGHMDGVMRRNARQVNNTFEVLTRYQIGVGRHG